MIIRKTLIMALGLVSFGSIAGTEHASASFCGNQYNICLSAFRLPGDSGRMGTQQRYFYCTQQQGVCLLHQKTPPLPQPVDARVYGPRPHPQPTDPLPHAGVTNGGVTNGAGKIVPVQSTLSSPADRNRGNMRAQ